MKRWHMAVPSMCVAAMALGACSGGTGNSGPSESDIVAAIKSELHSRDVSGLADEAEKASWANARIKKLGCKAGEPSGYTCDIEITSEKPAEDGKNIHVMTFRLLKGSEGWTVMLANGQ